MKKYKNIKDFENDIQEEIDVLPDNIQIGDIIYTMDNYDIDGKQVSYGNKRTFKGLIVETEDRYKGLKDALVEELNGFIRDDIVYLD